MFKPRFRLSTLMMVVTLVAIALGARVESLRREHSALARLTHDWPNVLWDCGEPAGPPSLLKGSRVRWIGLVNVEDPPEASQFRRFSSFGHLKAIDFSFTTLSRRHFECLPTLSSVEELRLVACSRLSDVDIHFVARSMPNLRQINVRETAITDECIPYLSQLRHLRSLDISRTHVVGCTIDKLEACELEELVLDETKINPNAVTGLLRLSNLRTLSVADTLLDAKSLFRFTELDSLRVLIVWGLDIDASQLDQLQKRLPMCTIIGP